MINTCKAVIGSIVLLFTLVNDSIAQHNITGLLLDQDKNQPIPYVSVWIKGTGYGTLSNGSGIFTFSVP